jgi:hypothetical protein
VAIFNKTMRIPIVIMEELLSRTEISGFDESGAVVGISEHEIDIDSALRFDGVMLSRCGVLVRNVTARLVCRQAGVRRRQSRARCCSGRARDRQRRAIAA